VLELLEPFGEEGLSPLARGNRHHGEKLVAEGGPIPARAGQPPAWIADVIGDGAYPRSRGATSIACAPAAMLGGLSPLARGNRHDGGARQILVGPIPARAGQPAAPSIMLTSGRAYPRSRGATILGFGTVVSFLGLSPLARGNRIGGAEEPDPVGPIPARAGQPVGQVRAGADGRAYPRSRGATHW